jgi:ATP-dependent DNA helicase DinG
MGRFERHGKGLLPSLAAELAAQGDLLSRASLDLLRERLLPALADARRATDSLLLRLHSRVDGEPSGVLRLGDDFAGDPVWQEGLGFDLDATLGAYRLIQTSIETIADRLVEAELSERQTHLLQELRGVMRRLESAADGLNRTLRPAGGGPATVRWLERTGPKGQQVALAAVPLDLAPILRELIFDRVKTVALTSATLAAGGDFAFLESRVGLTAEPCPVTVREILPSPFDFGAQCLFAIPNDVPDPREDEASHDAAIVQVVREIAAASDGGVFVLFTSHAALRRAAAELRPALSSRWPLLVQGEAPRDALLRRFRESGQAILLGTDSFWEGVDVPGRALRALVLTKLPFRVPSEPLTAARLERLADQGEDGFMGYLLPLAALKLKQGFGRLIRSRSDVGVVVLLDRRVVTKRYGKLVLSSLPPADRIVGTWREVHTRIEDFFARHGLGASV